MELFVNKVSKLFMYILFILYFRLYKSFLLKPIATSTFHVIDSISFFKEVFKTVINLTCESYESPPSRYCFEALRKSKDDVRATRKELDLVTKTQAMFCALKSVLKLITSQMFCDLIFKHYHLQKCRSKNQSHRDRSDSDSDHFDTEVIRKLFNQALIVSLEKNPLGKEFKIAELERCLSVLHCKVTKAVKESMHGK